MLKILEVTKRYGSTLALDQLSLQVERGEVFGLLGPNGAGKTTSVALAVGLLSPDAGRVEIGDHGSPLDPRVRQRIGVAPQALALYEDFSGEENLRFFARTYGLGSNTLRERVDWALRFVGLDEVRSRRASTYSGGMKRRLNLAVALVHDPELILLDEPTVGVDPQSRNAILERVKDLQQQGRTVVYTTHYMEEAQRLCDRIGIIDHGRLLALGTTDALIAQHGGDGILVVDDGEREHQIPTTEPLAALAKQQRQGPVEAFHYHAPSLESVFLHLTGRELRD